MSKKIYIAGPMTGYPEFNFPTFMQVDEALTADGWVVFNPAARDVKDGVDKDSSFATGNAVELVSNGWDFRNAFVWDVNKVIESDAIFMLPGWEKSTGARAEHAVAVAMKGHYPEYQIIYG